LRSFVLSLALAFCLCGHAQSVSDSLQILLTTAADTTRLAILEQLAKLEQNSNRPKAFSYGIEALAIAKMNSDKDRTEQLLFLLGGIKRLDGNYDSARYFFEAAHSLSIELNNPIAISENLNAIGLTFDKQGNLPQALDNYLNALKIAEEHGLQKQTAQSLNNIGFVYKAQKKYSAALDYYERALTIQMKLGDQLAIAGAFNNIGLVHMQQESYKEAREWYLKSLSMLTDEHPKQLAMVYNNLGVTYENQGYLKEGRLYYDKSVQLKLELNDLPGLASTYGNIADNYLEDKKLEEAILYANKSLTLSEKIGSLEYMITATKILARCYEEQKDFKQAYYHFVKHKKYQDSLFNEDKSRVMEEMVAKYEVEKKERENSSLKMAATLSQSMVSKQQLIILAAGGTLGIVLLLLTFLYQSYQRSKTLASELSIQKMQAEKMNEQLKEVVQEKNNVLNIMAHDLRSPMNKVLGLTHVIRTEGGVNPQQEQCLDMISSVADHGRRIISDLLTINKEGASKLTISNFSLPDFMRDIVNQHIPEAKRKGISLHLELPNYDVTVTTDKDSLARILDNLISNAIKFSPRQKSVILRAGIVSDQIHIAVVDYGPGFSEEDKINVFKKFTRLSAQPTGGEPSTGLGLAIVKHLVTRLSGDIRLDSTTGKGSVFTISLPQSHFAGLN
jgi:signal transduction histidine kinase/Tfp pilus assembly protein PilF